MQLEIRFVAGSSRYVDELFIGKFFGAKISFLKQIINTVR